MKTKHPANSLIAKLLEVKTDNRDIWVVYELGGISMAKALFKMRGEFVKGERMYKIEH